MKIIKDKALNFKDDYQFISHSTESGCRFDTQILEYYCAPQKFLIALRTKTIK